MLALYQPHNVLWFLPVSLLGGAIFAVACARRKVPGRTTPVQIASWCMAAGGIVAMIVISSWNSAACRHRSGRH